MKNLLINLFIASSFFVLTGCEKFLDTKPTDFLSSEQSFNTEKQLQDALSAVYMPLTNGALYRSNMLFSSGQEADEGYFTATAASGPQIYNFNSSDNIVQGIWAQLYLGVNRANSFLANVDNNREIDQSIRDRVRGEALFLRGYYYFMLGQLFGGVPLILEPTDLNNVSIARASLKEIYEQVLSDMTQAEGLVGSAQQIVFGGRVNKSAVRGLLARVCLYMAGEPLKDEAKYTEARNWAKKVMDDNEVVHRLNPSYSDVFIKYARDEYDIKESIWEVEFYAVGTEPVNVLGNNGYANSVPSNNDETGRSIGRIRVTANLYRLYKAGDLRRDWAIGNFTYNATGVSGAKTLLTATPTDASLYGRHMAKFRREYELKRPRLVSYTGINVPLLRYSDVLLMFAEAENKINNGPTQSAYDAINLVRRRGFGKLITGATNIAEFDLSGLNYEGFFKEIRDERSRELCFEMLRYADLKRWGIFVSTMHERGEQIRLHVPTATYAARYLNVTDQLNTWPIPTTEMSLNNKLVQNKDW